MIQNSLPYLLPTPTEKKPTYTATELLAAALGGISFLWYIQFLWRRRKLYQHSRSLPGPFALPLIGSALSFVGNPYDIFHTISKMFNTYPGIFRVWFGTRLFYAVSDPKYFEILLTSPYAQVKENLYSMAEPVIGQGLFIAPVSKWKKNRKIIMPTFNQKILDQFVEVFVEGSEVLTQVLQKHAGKGEIDLFNIMSRCTLDIICETAMGVKVQAQTTGCEFTQWSDRELQSVAESMKSFTRKVVTERIRAYKSKSYEEPQEPRRKAFLDLLLDISYKDNNRFTDEEILDETLTFMVAGSDTTATTNCFLFVVLGLHQDVQQKVLEEILEFVGPIRSVDVQDLPKLKYMERVIKETLRLFPVGPFIVRSVEEDVDLGDHVIAKGCSIVFGIRRVHTNEAYWPEPFKFDPDRFLPEEISKRHSCSYVPFSYGPRNCIGMKYAMMAMKSLLATVLRKFEIHTSYAKIEDIELKTNLVIRPKDGFKVSVKSRT
ncbi:cytochrome P450 4C1-like isoform X2 [Cylas formicarius]|uniref:cytochrome P450 4C1-like isoform X2 n=1 Tax=Cylas formicarius TaxID=197179 RepID=UPI002958552F|nr:cytochrome P450 4C1-like isoform X2 [Cylas formicarius]